MWLSVHMTGEAHDLYLALFTQTKRKLQGRANSQGSGASLLLRKLVHGEPEKAKQ